MSNVFVGFLEMAHTVVNTSNDMFGENLYRLFKIWKLFGTDRKYIVSEIFFLQENCYESLKNHGKFYRGQVY